INVGGGDPATGPVSGIHWHMNLANEITFISSDAQRQTIPWVQSKDSSGKVTVYAAGNSPLTQEQIASAAKRRMDCIDCHNRPAYIYTPYDVANQSAYGSNGLDVTLPYL